MDLKAQLALYPFLQEEQITSFLAGVADGSITEPMVQAFLHRCETIKISVEAHMRKEMELFGDLHEHLQHLTEKTQRECIVFAEKISDAHDDVKEASLLAQI